MAKKKNCAKNNERNFSTARNEFSSPFFYLPDAGGIDKIMGQCTFFLEIRKE